MKIKIRNRVRRFFVLILCLLLPSLARWATFDDASVEVVQMKVETHVEKNGNFKESCRMRFKILNEQGRQDLAEYTIPYSGDVDKVHIKKVAIETKGKEYAVYKWEDKHVASSDLLFEHQKQIKIALPRLEIGSVVIVEYDVEHTAKDLPNYASFPLSPTMCLVRSYEQTIDSKLPLVVQFNDPIDVLSMENKRSGPVQKIKIQNKTSFVRFPVSENPLCISQDKKPVVLICSEPSWKGLAERVAPLYEKVLSEPLPQRFEKIKDFALTKKTEGDQTKTEIDQINAVTTALINHITYVSISSIGERLAPHSFQDIDRLGRGDCKDYATSTVGILRAMGYQAHVVLVKRGVGQRDFVTTMGHAGAFNHAMVRVVGKKGHIYWIDPTNSVSMADGIFPDIQGKRALILDAKNGRTEQIPTSNPARAMRFLKKEVVVDFDTGHLRCTGFLDLKGEDAVNFCMASVYLPYQQRKEMIYDFLGGGKIDEKDRVRLDMPDISDRVVKDVTIGFDYRIPYACDKTNVGWAIDCGSLRNLTPILSVLQSQVGDLFLGMPRTQETSSFVCNVAIDNPSVADLVIDSPWLRVERKVMPEGDGIVVMKKTINKVAWISREDMRSEQFKSLKEALEQDHGFKLVVRPLNKSHNVIKKMGSGHKKSRA